MRNLIYKCAKKCEHLKKMEGGTGGTERNKTTRKQEHTESCTALDDSSKNCESAAQRANIIRRIPGS